MTYVFKIVIIKDKVFFVAFIKVMKGYLGFYQLLHVRVDLLL